MDMPYVETDCTFHASNGQSYTAGGAVVTPEHCVGYLKAPEPPETPTGAAYYAKERAGATGTFTDWHGNSLGTFRITAVWGLPFAAHLSDVMCQIEATVGGVVYTGRSAGYGMVYKGKRKAKQPSPPTPKPEPALQDIALRWYEQRLIEQGKRHLLGD